MGFIQETMDQYRIITSTNYDNYSIKKKKK